MFFLSKNNLFIKVTEAQQSSRSLKGNQRINGISVFVYNVTNQKLDMVLHQDVILSVLINRHSSLWIQILLYRLLYHEL